LLRISILQLLRGDFFDSIGHKPTYAMHPRTAAGQEWLANTVPDQPPGAVRVPLRYLDQVLSSAHRACIRLDVPWD
jgi:hypothetical protein